MAECAAPPDCGPRTFYAFTSSLCTRQSIQCYSADTCSPKDILPDPAGGLNKRHWLQSVVFLLLGTDKANSDCWTFGERRRGDPADGLRGTTSGNSIWKGYAGTTQQQLNSCADDVKSQIAAFMSANNIPGSVSVSVKYAGTGKSTIQVTIGQESVTVLKANDALVWSNL